MLSLPVLSLPVLSLPVFKVLPCSAVRLLSCLHLASAVSGESVSMRVCLCVPAHKQCFLVTRDVANLQTAVLIHL